MNGVGSGFPPGDPRVSDADRDRAMSQLSEAFQVGRITADELEQRTGQVLCARTGRELTAPLADLPRDRPPAARDTAPERAQRVLATRIALAAAAAACFAAAVTNALSSGPTAIYAHHKGWATVIPAPAWGRRDGRRAGHRRPRRAAARDPRLPPVPHRGPLDAVTRG